MSKPVLQGFLVRTMSGAVLLVTVLAAVLISQYTFLAFLLAISVGGMLEFYKMATLAGARPQRSCGIIMGVLIIIMNFLFVSGYFGNRAYIPLAALVTMFLPFFIEMYRKKENPIFNIASTIIGVVYIAIPLAMFSYIGFIAENVSSFEGYHPWIILSYIFIVWANDVGAYIFGVIFGRHKLFERLSPKKSWEGFFGGVAVAIAAAWLIDKLVYPIALPGNESALFLMGVALIVVVTGVLGDLVESMLKRSVNIKDSGNIMPGHGGFLDRFDALLLSAPFVFIYFLIFVF